MYPPSGALQHPAYLTAIPGFTQGGRFGDSWFGGQLPPYRRGAWHDVEVGLRLNTFTKEGRPNGEGPLRALTC